MDDCTVEGSAHRNNTPSIRVRFSTCGINAATTEPNNGYSMNVVPAMTACSL